MTCVFYGEIAEGTKQRLQIISLILRVLSVILTATVVSTYVAMIARIDKRGRFNNVIANSAAFPLRYGVYQLVSTSVYIGWCVAGTDALICCYWTAILVKPAQHAQANHRIGRTKLPNYYEHKDEEKEKRALKKQILLEQRAQRKAQKSRVLI